ncbi:type II toxin-antitoxin system RelE/ParE family toxin [Polaribacter litorisediminis]|uniref:type II toxin-antitoxin system RelE/ParE family toxin n=1 Tax=Polaribacter litorisediminis TaxID=1908341 RepID=UPI001CBFAE53|nr:type II toxin-antitoxin system RelE/ParE family toxin [Polaribacter litorisediminis]
MPIIKNYELTNETDADLEDIFDYTEQRHNQEQAIVYLLNIEDLFLKLCKQPNLGRLRNDIKENVFSIPIKKHIIFYKIDINNLIIIRVLHGSRDMPKHLKIK